MSRHRATGFAVLSVLLSFVASLFVWAGPAQANVRELKTTYRCDSDQGGGRSAITVKVDVPGQVTAGTLVPGRRISFRIVVPARLVRELRTYGVDEVSAVGRGKYRVGSKKVPIRHLKVRRTPVPAQGKMVIRGNGRAAGFTISEPGHYAVKVPAKFATAVTAYGTPIGDITVDLSCDLVSGAPATLSTLQVVS